MMDNPVGFLPAGFFGPVFSFLWTLGLLLLAIGGAVSAFFRYRRAPASEKQQIKWLLYAVGIFVGVYSIGAVNQSFESDSGTLPGAPPPVNHLDPGGDSSGDPSLPLVRYRSELPPRLY